MEKQESNQQNRTANGVVTSNRLAFGGLIAVCLLILQAFITTTPDVAVYIALGAICVAIPLLVGYLTLSILVENGLVEGKPSIVVDILGITGIVGTVLSIDAALWHVHWLLGVAFLGSALLAIVVFYNYMDKYRINSVSPQFVRKIFRRK